jgi:hypothetical protein
MKPAEKRLLSFLIQNRLPSLEINKNSMASVRKRTIPTERPPLFSEVSANFFLRIEGAT